jgi:rod shape determining protein RodA
MNKGLPLLRHIDPVLLGLLLLVMLVGSATLYSATGGEVAAVVRQCLRYLAGGVLMVLIAQLHPSTIGRWSLGLYGLAVLLLLAVEFFGEGKGATRWLNLGFVRFQPSELAKLAVPIYVAWFLCDRALPPRAFRVATALLIIAVPVVLVERQPDLGTAALVAFAGLSVLFMGGLSWRFIALAASCALVAAPLLWVSMHDYQQQRVLTFLDPSADPLGAGYHIIQSTIAVGSGGVLGKGWMRGTQSQLDFIPERHTDFIFAVFCEEFGLTGVLLLNVVYALIILRGLYIALHAQEDFGRILAASIACTFFIYVFVNMGMVVGRLPVVGVPLPLISYGGTSLVTLLAGFGMLMSIHTHRRMLSGP